MPTAPLRPCATPGCRELVTSGHCTRHARARDLARGTAQERGYTRRWAARSQAFRRRFPLCGMRPGGQRPVLSRCFDEGRQTPATVVDHVVPHRGDQGLFWDELGNWQALCDGCHGRKIQAGR